MKYISTRGISKKLSFSEVILQGLASDGGLYIPENIPSLTIQDIEKFRNLTYQELAFEITKLFVGEDIPDNDLKKIIEKSYSSFNIKEILKVKKINQNIYLSELFHGPTLAFKDFALQLLGNLIEYVTSSSNIKSIILGATSGDTGSAAIYGFMNSKNSEIFILHPHNKVSDFQRKQMTSVQNKNVHNIAVKGNFDDCQNIVKNIFNNRDKLADNYQFIAVNSINWGRIMAQIVYYFYSYIKSDIQDKVSFCVPTGNFGNIFAGYIAKEMGLPIDKMIIATNENDILHRCLQNNDYSKKDLKHTITPSMDIMISSNFERMLYYAYDKNSQAINELMHNFNEFHKLELDCKAIDNLHRIFSSNNVTETEIIDTIYKIYQSNNEILDPHTATGIFASMQNVKNNEKIISLATAHPIKFQDAIDAVNNKYKTNINIENNEKFADENYNILENNSEVVYNYINNILKG